jgi:hypothetical protein
MSSPQIKRKNVRIFAKSNSHIVPTAARKRHPVIDKFMRQRLLFSG